MNEDDILEVAARWHLRQSADDMDWQAFQAWLDADPRHGDAFDDIALLDEAIDHHRDTLRRILPEIESIPVTPHDQRWRRRGIVGGLAAVAACALLVVVTRNPASTLAPQATTYSASATPREVRIADARITLAPGSSITATNGDPARLTLIGRAVFDVTHDPDRTLVVRAEGYAVRDVGTRFEIVAGAGIVAVNVAQGEVAMNPVDGGTPVRIVAGRSATGFADGRMLGRPAGKAALGSWRTGPLIYDAMPLGLVVADLARATGRPVVADPAIAGRPFTGVLAPGDGMAMTTALAALAGLEARRQGDTIRLADRVRP